MASAASISACGLYRYRLHRSWGCDSLAPYVAWIMLNPSTADAEQDDPTIRRCRSFTKRLGYDRMEIVNLFALRSPNPNDLLDSLEAGLHTVGVENDAHIVDVCARASRVIVAWGSHRATKLRSAFVLRLTDERAECLGRTKDGSPRHPLYVRSDAALIEYKAEGAPRA